MLLVLTFQTAITGVDNFDQLPVIPQVNNSFGNVLDTFQWTKVSITYEAFGSEAYLIVGNYLDDTASTLTLINNDAPFDFVQALVDDVSLTPCKDTGEE